MQDEVIVKIPFSSHFTPKIGTCIGILNFVGKCAGKEWFTDSDCDPNSPTFQAVKNSGRFVVGDQFVIGCQGFDETIYHFHVVAIKQDLLFVADYSLGYRGFDDLPKNRKNKVVVEYKRLVGAFGVADVCPNPFELWGVE